MDNQIGKLPEMDGEPLEVNKEMATPAAPSTVEKPADTEAGELVKEPEATEGQPPKEPSKVSDDAGKEEAGLATTREKLLKEVQDLRRERRELRQEEAPKPLIVEDVSIDPETEAYLDKYAKKKGLVSRTEFEKTTYKSQLNEAKDQWLEAHPEYLFKSNDDLWSAINDKLSVYKSPTNPKEIKTLLSEADKKVREEYPERFAGGLNLSAKKQALKTAGLGTGGGGSPSTEAFDSTDVMNLRRGGFSEEEISNILKRKAQSE